VRGVLFEELLFLRREGLVCEAGGHQPESVRVLPSQKPQGEHLQRGGEAGGSDEPPRAVQRIQVRAYATQVQFPVLRSLRFRFSTETTPSSDDKVANRNVGGFGWEIAHEVAVSRRPPNSLDTIVARTQMYTVHTLRKLRIFPPFKDQFLSPGAKPFDSQLLHRCTPTLATHGRDKKGDGASQDLCSRVERRS
jgi:hypothetical protein